MPSQKSPFKTKEFEALKSSWYQKLKRHGFEDIETSDNQYLKEWQLPVSRINVDLFQIKQEYYYRARHFLRYWQFKSVFEKEIWRMHSEGIALRQISDFLNTLILNPQMQHSPYCTPQTCDILCPMADRETLSQVRFNKDKVDVIVKRLREEMKSLFWGSNSRACKRKT